MKCRITRSAEFGVLVVSVGAIRGSIAQVLDGNTVVITGTSEGFKGRAAHGKGVLAFVVVLVEPGQVNGSGSSHHGYEE